jgi:hypothetical protein
MLLRWLYLLLPWWYCREHSCLMVQDAEELLEDVDAHGRIGANAAIVPVIAPTSLAHLLRLVHYLILVFWRSV